MKVFPILCHTFLDTNHAMIRLLFLLFLTLTLSQGYSPTNKFVGCGGTIESNSGSLTYPETGLTPSPGEVCVWTIHLEDLQDFRITLSNLNISSGNNSFCSEAGLRLYSLTNLVSSPEPESYT